MPVEIHLHFPDDDQSVQLPAVPRKGDAVEWTDENDNTSDWIVTEITFTAYQDREGSIHVSLDPAPSA